MADYTLTAAADTFPAGQETAGDDRIYGLEGDDVLDGGAGADLLDGGDGFDTVTYASAAAGIFVNPMSRVPRNDGTGDTFVSIERFVLSAFDDYFRADGSFTAGFEADGGAGNDRIYATGFADTLLGGDGNDDLRGGEGDDVVRGGAGNDLIHGDGGRDAMFGDAGDDLIYAGTNNDVIDGGDGFDTVMLYDGPGYYELSLLDDGSVKILRLHPEYENAGKTTLQGSFDILTNVERLRFYDGTVFDLAAWIDAASVPAGYNLVNGTEAGETLTGTEDRDVIYGRGGDDTLLGGGGDDILEGGAGKDFYDGDEGFDTVTFHRTSGAILGTTRGFLETEDPKHDGFGDTFTNIERVELTAFNDFVLWRAENGVELLGFAGDDILTGGIGDDSVDGGEGKDVLAGGDGNDVLRGGAGADRLDGGAGDDMLDGGEGADTVHGGIGYDTLRFEGRSTGVSFGTGGTIDDVEYWSIEEYRLTEFDDTIRVPHTAGHEDNQQAGVVSVYGGGGNDVIEGKVGGGKLYGEDGNDTLTAGHYGSFLDGGAGDDSLNSAWGGDLIEGGEGTDTVYFTRPQSEYHIERDGDAIVVAHIPSGWVDRLTGVEFLSFPHPVFLERVTVAVASLPGGDTAAPLRAGSLAADSMAGESALANALFGLSGSDTLTGGDEADMLSGGEDDDVLAGAGGADSLYGGDGNDRMDGGAGADRMAGGAGDDVYEVDDLADIVIESAGEGTDHVRTALGSRSDPAAMYVLADNVENLTGTSATGQGVFANALDNLVRMGAGADLVVLHHGGNDRVFAGGGNDFLHYGAAFTNGDSNDGGGGNDTVGLLGRYDSLVFDADDLLSIEKLAVYGSGDPAAPNGYNLTSHDANVAAGQEMMVVALSLGTNEALAFNGSAETDGRFNIRGGKGADTLTGGAGADTLYGNLGTDMLRGGAGADIFEYRSAAESEAGAADVILDFARGDRINLIGIDADGNPANGDNRFSWIGGNAFSGQAGELRAYQHAQHNRTWVVEGDVDGDGAADFMLYVVAAKGFTLEQADFWL